MTDPLGSGVVIPYGVVLAGNWKLQRLKNPQKLWLFDLANDPTEKNNRAASEPAKVAELVALLDAQNKQYVKPMWPSLLQGPVYIDHTLEAAEKPGEEFIRWDN